MPSIVLLIYMFILDCDPSGVPNGQWMKIPRPGKRSYIMYYVHGITVYFNVSDCHTVSFYCIYNEFESIVT